LWMSVCGLASDTTSDLLMRVFSGGPHLATVAQSSWFLDSVG
jgi:hypothetical protein